VPLRDPLDFPRVDGEELAIRELAARASRLRRIILMPAIVAGLAGSVVGYLLVRDLQFTILHAQLPSLSGVVGGIPPFAAALRIAQKLGNAAVSTRAPAWVDEQIRLRDLPPGALDEYLTVL
jgi:hypothetical protein